MSNNSKPLPFFPLVLEHQDPIILPLLWGASRDTNIAGESSALIHTGVFARGSSVNRAGWFRTRGMRWEKWGERYGWLEKHDCVVRLFNVSPRGKWKLGHLWEGTNAGIEICPGKLHNTWYIYIHIIEFERKFWNIIVLMRWNGTQEYPNFIQVIPYM